MAMTTPKPPIAPTWAYPRTGTARLAYLWQAWPFRVVL